MEGCSQTPADRHDARTPEGQQAQRGSDGISHRWRRLEHPRTTSPFRSTVLGANSIRCRDGCCQARSGRPSEARSADRTLLLQFAIITTGKNTPLSKTLFSSFVRLRKLFAPSSLAELIFSPSLWQRIWTRGNPGMRSESKTKLKYKSLPTVRMPS
jgi:hypothetical protein